jgi:hypothetical protein
MHVVIAKVDQVFFDGSRLQVFQALVHVLYKHFTNFIKEMVKRLGIHQALFSKHTSENEPVLKHSSPIKNRLIPPN